MRLMKSPKPGTNMATRVAPTTSPVRMILKTAHCWCSSGNLARNLLCAPIARHSTSAFQDVHNRPDSAL